MIIEQRIQNYVERFFLQSEMTEYPNIRQVARGLNVGMKLVFDTVEGDHRCDTQGWNIETVDYRDLEIYTDTDRIETAWEKYWKQRNEESIQMPEVRQSRSVETRSSFRS